MVTEPEWRHVRRDGATALVLAGILFLTGCSSEPAEDGGGQGRPTPKPAATGTLEELAKKAGCDPNVQTDAAELRQANCKTSGRRYVLTTFATDRGQREWINEAKDYGGSYLVGRRWVAVGEPDVVAALRGRLGGTVETASPHHSGTSGGGGSEDGHSGHHTS
ncbi:hypothetical protein ACWF76_29615 [Streptomyces globisporus]|uniref:Lipoprotein n=1 Tax=Streptomyces globisporus TaxID=1908 RepID=A0A423UWH5_STRGL|nr:hypothetical protein [Streptomyces globisporus]ROV66695.1 hypothetical protein D3105_20590 [Streptomyces globisporus]